jgi:hypothetical protein
VTATGADSLADGAAVLMNVVAGATLGVWK